MTSRSTPPQAASDIHPADDDQARIDDEMDAFEAIVRSIHETDRQPATSILTMNRWH